MQAGLSPQRRFTKLALIYRLWIAFKHRAVRPYRRYERWLWRRFLDDRGPAAMTHRVVVIHTQHSG